VKPLTTEVHKTIILHVIFYFTSSNTHERNKLQHSKMKH